MQSGLVDMHVLGRAVLGGVFLVPGTLHVVDLSQFAWQIYEYQIIGADLAAQVAMPLAMFEIWLGASFLLARGPRVNYFFASGLLYCFAGVIGFTLLNNRIVDCGCLGLYSPKVSWTHVVVVSCLASFYGVIGLRSD